MSVTFNTSDIALSAAFQSALSGLRENLQTAPVFPRPVLLEGAAYRGIWLECGPLEGMLYGRVDPQAAQDCHRIFFHLQRADGQLPCLIRPATGVGWAQIQMVVPIATTALETYQTTGDEAFLEEAYPACARWDGWLARYRDTRGAGLCELFCEYDSGHDNSPRFAHGLPKECPDGDARRCADFPGLPFLAPDLSATVYGGRVALGKMARLLGRDAEAQRWDEHAEHTRQALLNHCFDAQDECFYDVDAQGQFVRVRGDALTRVLSEHVVDQPLFERIYARHIRNPSSFWTPYPLPSVAADDPAFVRSFPANSWGGASQALTALRAPRWFGFYGKHADLMHLMSQWVDALTRGDGFRQQINPYTGAWTPAPDGYSPALLCVLEFTARLHGVRQEGGALEWTCRLPAQGAWAAYSGETTGGTAQLAQDAQGATLTLAGQMIAHVHGACRVITNTGGIVTRLIGTEANPTPVILSRPSRPPQTFTLTPDAVVPVPE